MPHQPGSNECPVQARWWSRPQWAPAAVWSSLLPLPPFLPVLGHAVRALCGWQLELCAVCWCVFVVPRACASACVLGACCQLACAVACCHRWPPPYRVGPCVVCGSCVAFARPWMCVAPSLPWVSFVWPETSFWLRRGYPPCRQPPTPAFPRARGVTRGRAVSPHPMGTAASGFAATCVCAPNVDRQRLSCLVIH